MVGLSLALRRAADASLHRELHGELVRRDGSQAAPLHSYWTSLIPAAAAVGVTRPGSGPDGFACVCETGGPPSRTYL